MEVRSYTHARVAFPPPPKKIYPDNQSDKRPNESESQSGCCEDETVSLTTTEHRFPGHLAHILVTTPTVLSRTVILSLCNINRYNRRGNFAMWSEYAAALTGPAVQFKLA
jgi:hypothetical protein